MTPLYSKETANMIIRGFPPYACSSRPDEVIRIINLIENGNEVMELLVLAAEAMKRDGHTSVPFVAAKLIQKIKGEG